MKLSISNIAWTNTEDENIYAQMQQYGFTGLEIAPTRIFPESPYDRLNDAKTWSCGLKENYGLSVSSMQSIWYGRQERIFGSDQERQTLLDYTKKAMDFAQAIGCRNLVFGCPRNRSIPENANSDIAVDFFRKLGDYAKAHDTVLAIEANLPIYHTNYITETPAAISLVRQVDSPGFLMNLDTGTMIAQTEPCGMLRGNVQYINHVHISEPGLKPIEKRKMHNELFTLLESENYNKYISIEMGQQDDRSAVSRALAYVGCISGHN